jgi:glutathione synthase/RimK-type ligase-like ATP-grasp enzyme
MLNNIKILITACEQLGIKYEILHKTQNLVRVRKKQDHFFTNYSTPFSTQSVAQIFKDKEYTYQILKDKINTPKTQAFISPFCNEKYQSYLEFYSIPEIAEEIKRNFALPVIVKRNRGSSGNNVFLCDTDGEIKQSLEIIFDINSKNYDYVALVQEKVNIMQEYRVIVFNQQVQLVYEKDKSQAEFTGNISPLHWEGAIAKHITDEKIISNIEQFIQPIYTELPIVYAGLDVAIDTEGKYWLIEINSHPNYDIFTRDNGDTLVIELFKKMLASLQ